MQTGSHGRAVPNTAIPIEHQPVESMPMRQQRRLFERRLVHVFRSLSRRILPTRSVAETEL